MVEPLPAPQISPELMSRAHRESNGELAWRRADVAEAAEALATAGYAVLGGEAWAILPDGRLYGQIPQADGSPPGVYHWSVEPGWQPESETWEAFCRRAADQTRMLFLGPSYMMPEADTRRELRQHVWFHLAFESKSDHERMEARRASLEASPPPGMRVTRDEQGRIVIEFDRPSAGQERQDAI